MTGVINHYNAGIWRHRHEDGHLAVFRVGEGGADFHVWKHTKWTDEQIAKAIDARPEAHHVHSYAVKWMPELQSDATMIAYKDWLDEDVNLRLVWLHQVAEALMKFGHVNRSMVGTHWSIEGVDITLI